MKPFLELLKKIFSGDKEKEKLIDDAIAKLKDEKPEEKPKDKQKETPEFDLEKFMSKFDTKTLENSDNKELIGIIIEMKKGQDALLNEMAENKKKEEERNKILAEKAKAENDKKINDLLELAKKEGRIPPKDEAKINSFRKLLETDFESAKIAIEALPRTNVKAQTDVGTHTKTDKPIFKNAFGGNSLFLEKVKKDLAEK